MPYKLAKIVDVFFEKLEHCVQMGHCKEKPSVRSIHSGYMTKARVLVKEFCLEGQTSPNFWQINFDA